MFIYTISDIIGLVFLTVLVIIPLVGMGIIATINWIRSKFK